MKKAVVNINAIVDEGVLKASYYVYRLPGESYAAYTVRREIEELERRAIEHDNHAARLRAEAARLKEQQ